MRLIARALFRTVLREYPFYSGCGTVANAPVFKWATRGLDGPVDVRLRNGLKLRVDPTEFLGRSVYFTREWDPKISWAIERILRAGDTFVDIGAHCGISSVIAAGVVGPKGCIHAFEPQPSMIEMLNQTVSVNNFSNFRVHAVALSDNDGKANLHVQLDKPILASLSRSEEHGTNIEVTVKQTGSFLRSLHIPPIRLIKIDVEGHEVEVFNGSCGYFENENRPDAILFESISAEGPFYQRPVVRWLDNLGYKFLALPKLYVGMKAFRVNEDADHTWHDFVAVAPQCTTQIFEALNCK